MHRSSSLCDGASPVSVGRREFLNNARGSDGVRFGSAEVYGVLEQFGREVADARLRTRSVGGSDGHTTRTSGYCCPSRSRIRGKGTECHHWLDSSEQAAWSRIYRYAIQPAGLLCFVVLSSAH